MKKVGIVLVFTLLPPDPHHCRSWLSAGQPGFSSYRALFYGLWVLPTGGASRSLEAAGLPWVDFLHPALPLLAP